MICMPPTPTLAFFENLFRGPDLIILLIIGLLIFGKRLPEVGRGLGRSIVEFRKGMKGVQDEVEDAVNKPDPPQSRPPPQGPPCPAPAGRPGWAARTRSSPARPSRTRCRDQFGKVGFRPD